MYRRVGLLLFAAGWGANHFAALLVVYRSELGLSAASVGLLFGAYALGLVPGLVLAGRASDRRGRRALVLPASLVAIAASGLLALGSHGFAILLAGRLLYGLAMGSIMSPGSVWVQELSTPGKGPRRATLALSAGFGLGPLLTGVLAEFGAVPMVLPYLVHAAAMAVVVLYARSVPETVGATVPAPREPGGDAAGGPAADARSFGRAELRVLVPLLPVAPWAFGFAAIAVAILPGAIRSAVGRPILYASSVIATTLVSGLLVQPLTSRLGPRGDLVGLAVGAAGVFLGAEAVAIASPGLVFGAAVLIGAGYGLVITTGLREVAERVRADTRGTAVGVYYVLTYVGFALPFVHAIAAKTLGDVLSLRVTGALALGSLVVRALVRRRS